jgi:hypothetical protein
LEKHILIVGGTGMLREAVMELAREASIVSVIARNYEGLDTLDRDAQKKGWKINPLPVDYRDADLLKRHLENAVNRYGPVTTAVVWVHSDAPEALDVIAEILDAKCKVFYIGGSSLRDRTVADVKATSPFKKSKLRLVTLGFIVENGSSRWLTNAEISAGVVEAFKSDSDKVVGQLQPAGQKPA